MIYYIREVGAEEPLRKPYMSKGGARRLVNEHNGQVDRHAALLADGIRSSTPPWLQNKWEVVAYSLTFVGVV